MKKIMKKHMYSFVFWVSLVVMFCLCGLNVDKSYADTQLAEIDTVNKELYANGYVVTIEDETYFGDNTYDSSDVKLKKDENSVALVAIEENRNGEIKGEYYYIPSGYTIYGGAKDADCKHKQDGLANAILINGGEVDTIVCGGKNGDFDRSNAPVFGLYINGGTVGKVKLMENGDILCKAWEVKIDPWDEGNPINIGEICVGAEKGENGRITVEDIPMTITDYTNQCTAKIIPGYHNGNPLYNAKTTDDNAILYAFNIRITGESFQGLSVVKKFWGWTINDIKVVRLHGNGGTFDGKETEIYSSAKWATKNNVRYVDSFSVKEKPQRKGYSFIGWAPRATSKAVFGGGTGKAGSRNCDYYAVWEAINKTKLTKASLSATAYTFNGKVKTPAVTVKAENLTVASKITKDTNRVDLTYASGRKNVGTYKVTIKGKGNYAGTITKSFKINPKGVSISKLSKSKKAFTVKWKKPSSIYRKQMTGYQIRYSTSSKMSKAETETVKSATATNKKISKLKAKKKYYVQIRTYKTVKGVKYYSGWSKVKSVKTR